MQVVLLRKTCIFENIYFDRFLLKRKKLMGTSYYFSLCHVKDAS